MRLRQPSPTRLIITERPGGSQVLSWALAAGTLISARLSYTYASVAAGVMAALCVVGLVLGWRWGAWRTIRLVRGGSIRLRAHRGLRWEYPVADLEQVEVSGCPDEHGGRDYGVIVFVRNVGWVPLSSANLLKRETAVAISDRIREVLQRAAPGPSSTG